jgi:cyclopropane fatty-acyl-phospholipid synthase-like methyltransferase
MASDRREAGDSFEIAPYFDVLLERLEGGDPRARAAFGRHVHWGYWPDPESADGTPADYAAAAERLCVKVCDAAGVGDGMRILDVGCGLGGTIASLNERFSAVDLVGVNIDPRQLRRAAETVRPRGGNRITWVEADACRLSFAPDTFDVVLAVECVFHFASRADFLSGAARALVAGGRLALSDFVPPAEELPLLRKHAPGQDEATRLSYGKVDLLCPVEEYRTMADAADLALCSVEDVSRHTLPTYAFLRADQRGWRDRATARMHERATARLESACRLGLLRYSILGFQRRAAGVVVAA